MKVEKLRQLIRALHENESGEIPVGPILVIGFIVIPLVIVMIMFADELGQWFRQQWDGFTAKSPKTTF